MNRDGPARDGPGQGGGDRGGRGQRRGRGRDSLVPNIGDLQRRRRLIFGLVAWAVAGAGLASLLVLDANRLWRLALFIPLWAGAIGFFQHREKT